VNDGPRVSDRALAWATTALLAAFAALAAVAMARYPGGAWFDRGTHGYAFWSNYLCDLAGPVALDGHANPGAPFGRVMMLAFAVALVPFWCAGARLAATERMARAIRTAGCTACAIAVFVPFTAGVPGPWHSIASLAAGTLGSAASAALLLACWQRRAALRAALGALAFASGSVVAVVYLHAILTGYEPAALPPAQKVAALSYVAWMLAIAHRAR